jgi:hypothetical protein
VEGNRHGYSRYHAVLSFVQKLSRFTFDSIMVLDHRRAAGGKQSQDIH